MGQRPLVVEKGTIIASPSSSQVTYPYRFHIHNPGVLSKLNDATFRTSTAANLIPHICPGAFSVAKEIGLECTKGFAVVHRGRSCHDWTYALSKNPVTLEKCRNLVGCVGTQPDS